MRVAVVAGPEAGHAFPAIALCLRLKAAGDSPVLMTGREWLGTARAAGIEVRELAGLDPEASDDDDDSTGTTTAAASAPSRALFLLLAATITLGSAVSALLSVHLLSILQQRGVPLAAAVGLGALVGPAQVGARAIEMLELVKIPSAARRIAPRQRGAWIETPSSRTLHAADGASRFAGRARRLTAARRRTARAYRGPRPGSA